MEGGGLRRHQGRIMEGSTLANGNPHLDGEGRLLLAQLRRQLAGRPGACSALDGEHGSTSGDVAPACHEAARKALDGDGGAVEGVRAHLVQLRHLASAQEHLRVLHKGPGGCASRTSVTAQ